MPAGYRILPLKYRDGTPAGFVVGDFTIGLYQRLVTW